jgi:hypothetical protein
MYLKSLTAFIVLILSMGPCLAEQPSVRIDLTAPRLVAAFASIPFVFEDSDQDCPEDRSTIRVTDGVLTRHHLNLPPIEQSVFLTRIAFNPIDDATYSLQFIRTNCRVDIDIRQQLRDGDHWRSLLVTEERRPSLSEEARQEAVRRRLGDTVYRRLGDLGKASEQISLDELNRRLRTTSGPKRWAGSQMSFGFPFDEAPKSCMDVFGEYQITKNSFAMAFFAPLSGELNKFVMEGSDLDPTHARIYLTKDDCRFEFTISQSGLRDSRWLALPLRPVPDDQAAKPAEPTR